ncbi:BLUF domain-containing protein [Erythrobacteraceae bacterium CFH 75059]|uniref:BLUF domain-containing protein n=1 Tax=Qipengyuania thermophila TaxID=2509361 RepID=UPI00101FED9F|nr:BLUF domain-containing protein [Qipengyuania thermophila]TCD06693.1 BLUF domain-containing protein [Erythrobacteraceae bacterium CFH 75059]
MRQMVYTSRAVRSLDQADIFAIVQQSAHNNLARDVTGFLIYADDRFLQLIEGEHAVIGDLLAIISADPRHTQINVAVDVPIAERSFPRWRMHRVGRTPASIAELRATLSARPQTHPALRELDLFLG